MNEVHSQHRLRIPLCAVCLMSFAFDMATFEEEFKSRVKSLSCLLITDCVQSVLVEWQSYIVEELLNMPGVTSTH